MAEGVNWMGIALSRKKTLFQKSPVPDFLAIEDPSHAQSISNISTGSAATNRLRLPTPTVARARFETASPRPHLR